MFQRGQTFMLYLKPHIEDNKLKKVICNLSFSYNMHDFLLGIKIAKENDLVLYIRIVYGLLFYLSIYYYFFQNFYLNGKFVFF